MDTDSIPEGTRLEDELAYGTVATTLVRERGEVRPLLITDRSPGVSLEVDARKQCDGRIGARQLRSGASPSLGHALGDAPRGAVA